VCTTSIVAPPGQAKKWRIGRQLPSDVIFHDLGREILEVLGAPPRSHRFVCVDDDILRVNRFTGMVVDAIDLLGTD
jgi:hypothetical protein